MTKEEMLALREIMENVVVPIKQEIAETKKELKLEIKESEERANIKFQQLDTKMDSMYVSLKEDMATSEREIKVYIENTAQKQIQTIAEGHMNIRRDMKELHELDKEVSNLKDRVFALEMKAKQG